MSKALDEFDRLSYNRIKALVKAQIVWATVTDVNWDAKTMTATGLVDGLPFHDVSLGLGSFHRKPKVNSKCRLGIIENQSAATFLLDADAFEEGIFTSGNTEFTIKETGFILKQNNESLRDVFNDMIDEINKIVVIQGNTIDVAAMMLIKQRLNTILIA